MTTLSRPDLAAVITLIDEHADKDLTVPELARFARVSVRWLQRRFQDELGVSPSTYIRLTRLRRIHDDLVAADPEAGCTVEAVTSRWGVRHSGRFAAWYRSHYDEFPSATLHRR
ncbi:helix-turn-helix transcriptional regulator [Amycolatopsis thermalba]|uniref:Helix-turn-helix transcriptional regulator n=1 Tax=Amycolatopsis thermalba TaxID=944492 RepID=A0ABY4NUP4_9PSEU|nr:MULTISPECIES: helix-turn-helix transcriptional regulator [Amycolatopsis]UQS23758.1 helix-turn-helix transcriptional regulator [Amycolatopsis thermalba]